MRRSRSRVRDVGNRSLILCIGRPFGKEVHVVVFVADVAQCLRPLAHALRNGRPAPQRVAEISPAATRRFDSLSENPTAASMAAQSACPAGLPILFSHTQSCRIVSATHSPRRLSMQYSTLRRQRARSASTSFERCCPCVRARCAAVCFQR